MTNGRVTFPAPVRLYGVYSRGESRFRCASATTLVGMYRTCRAARQFTDLPDALLTHIAEYATCHNAPVFNGAEPGTVVVLGYGGQDAES